MSYQVGYAASTVVVPIVTYADVRAHLNLTDDRERPELQGFINAATEMIEKRIGSVTVATYTETYDAQGWFTISLRHTPVIDVASVVEYRYGTLAQPLVLEPLGGSTPPDGFGYRIDSPDRGALSRYNASGGHAPFRGPVVVSYTAGRGTIPAAVRLATLITVAYLWQTQRGSAPPPMMGGQAPTNALTAGGIPPAALELLYGFNTRGPVIA